MGLRHLSRLSLLFMSIDYWVFYVVEQCRCSCVDFKKGLTKAHVLVKTGIIKTLVYFDKQGKKVDTWINATSGSYETIPGK